MTRDRVLTLCLIGACATLFVACKGGRDDDDGDGNTTGSGGTVGSGGAIGSGGAGSGGASGSGGKGSAGAGGSGSGGTGSGGTGSGGTGSGGTGSGGTGSGGTGSGGTIADAGMDAASGGAVTATAMLTGFSGGDVAGTAVFTKDGDSVTVEVHLMDCPDGEHPVHIHDGTSCTDATMQGMHWGPARGEGIPNVVCADGHGTAMLTRSSVEMPMLAWTIGGAEMTDVVGHAFVVHMNDEPKTRIGCGVITAD